MVNLVSLHSQAHKSLRLNPALADAQVAGLNMLPVMLSEFLKLAVQYPITLSKNKETGKFSCVAVLGFAKGENLFWEEGRWNALYRPLHLERQPFSLGEEAGQYMLCFDPQSKACSEQGGEPLFDAEGSPTSFLQKKQAVLAELLDGEAKSAAFIDKLVSLNLLKSLQLEITFDNGESEQVNGLYGIDEVALKQLGNDETLELNALGYLPHIYSMIVSMGQIFGLVQKKNQRLANVSAPDLKLA